MTMRRPRGQADRDIRLGRGRVIAVTGAVSALALVGCGTGGSGTGDVGAGGVGTGATSSPSAGSPSASSPSGPSATTTATTPPSPTAPATKPPTTTAAPTKPPTPTSTQTEPPSSTLRPGDEGARVTALQQRLSDLGYWLGTPDGTFGALTSQAVYALQGAAGLGRDGVVGPATRKALTAGTVPRVRSDGRALEIDLDRGLAVFVRDGKPWRMLHTSTGSFREYTYKGVTHLADTPRGSWAVTWRVDGVRDGELGELYRPIYFHHDGIAVHGYPSVPAYPASHGCARVTNAAIDMIWRENLMPARMPVIVS